jgi:hypothetical protein
MLSYPILYKTSFFIINGLAFLVNHFFCRVDKDFSTCLVCKNILTSFNHYGSVKNKLVSVVCFGILEGFVTSGNVNKTYVTTRVLPGLYTIVKSYSRNNNNHLVILLETYGLFTK